MQIDWIRWFQPRLVRERGPRGKVNVRAKHRAKKMRRMMVRQSRRANRG